MPQVLAKYPQAEIRTMWCPSLLAKLIYDWLWLGELWVYGRYIELVHGIIIQLIIGGIEYRY